MREIAPEVVTPVTLPAVPMVKAEPLALTKVKALPLLDKLAAKVPTLLA